MNGPDAHLRDGGAVAPVRLLSLTSAVGLTMASRSRVNEAQGAGVA